MNAALEDASLAVSELVSNAVMHAAGEIGLKVSPLGSGLRLEVRDSSSHLPVVDAASPDQLLANRTMAGRGLAMVASVCDRWGADPLPKGKVVWAEVGTGTRRPEPVVGFPRPLGRSSSAHSANAPGLKTVYASASQGRKIRLIGVPVALLVESTRQLVDLQRELQVVAQDRSGPPELSELSEAARPIAEALARWTYRDHALAQAAEAQGRERLDLELTIDPQEELYFERATRWIRRAGSLLRRRLLLTPQATPEVVAYRRWYEAEVKSQLRGAPPQPCPLAIPARRSG